MSGKVFALGAALTLFASASLFAGPIDPQSPEPYPDIGADGLFLQAAGPICFTSGDTYCLNDLQITANGPVADSNPGGNELDQFSGQLSGDLYDTTTSTDQGDWLIPYEGSGMTGLELVGQGFDGDGVNIPSEFASFDFEGQVGTWTGFEIEQTSPDATGSTSISGPTNGQYSIDSFFDVFTDISLDGGRTFITPNNSSLPTEFDLVASPEPGTFLLLLPGVLLVACYRSRYKRVCARAISRQS